MPGIMDLNPLYAVFHGTYTMAATTAAALFVVMVVSLWRHNLRQGLLFFSLMACYAAAAVDLSIGNNIIGFALIMGALAVLMFVAVGITGWKSRARTDLKLLQVMAPATLGSLSATFATSLSVELYPIDSPERLTWTQLDSYTWGLSFVTIVGFITCALVCATYDMASATARDTTVNDDEVLEPYVNDDESPRRSWSIARLVPKFGSRSTTDDDDVEDETILDTVFGDSEARPRTPVG